MSGPTYVRITADVTDLQAKLALAKAEFSSANGELRSMAQQMREAGTAANDNLRAGLSQAAEATAKARLEIAGLNRELRETTNATHSGGLKDILNFSESGVHIRFREMAEAAGVLGVAIGAMFVGKELLGGIEHVAELGANLLKLSEQTGIAVEALSGLHYAAEQEDVSAESLDTSVKRLGKSIQEALHVPTSLAADGFHEMGISQEFLRDHSNDTMAVLLKMADAFHTHADGAQADAVAMATLGRGGVELIPVLRQGSEEIQKQIEKQKELGSQITGPMAEAMKDHVKAVKDMKEAWFGAWLGISEAVLPVLTLLAHSFEGLTMLVHDMGAGIRAAAAAVDILNDAAGGGKTYEDAKAYKIPEHAGSKPAFKPPPPKEKTTKEPHDFDAQWKEQLDQELLAQQLFGEQAKAYELKFWQDKLVIAEAGGKNYVGAQRQITSTVYQLENEEARQAEEAQKRKDEARKRSLDEGYRDFKATIDAEREAAAGNIAEQLRLDQQLVTQAELLYNTDSANFQEALRKKTADMKAEIDKQMVPYKKMVDSIGNSFDQMFKGMLESTQNFGQTMQRLGLSLIEGFASIAIKKTEDWALSEIRDALVTEQTEAQKTAAVAAGASAQAGIRAAAAGEGKAAEATAGSASVFGDANKAAAGAYGAVAGIPVVGPFLAPVAAVAAFGAVMAFDVFSASGGFDVPSGIKPLTQLHEKEMVLPANLSERVRSMTEPGGASSGPQQMRPVNLHIHTNDASSFMDNITGLRREITRLVSDTMDNNPSLRPQN